MIHNDRLVRERNYGLYSHSLDTLRMPEDFHDEDEGVDFFVFLVHCLAL